MLSLPRIVDVIDSHTGGEPTRVVIAGGPDLGEGPLPQRVERFRREHDAFRTALVTEPRGNEVLVGALLVPPGDPRYTAAVIFFNNVGYIGMCGHGTIGLITTLAFLDRIGPGLHRLETRVGDVTATLHDDGSVSVENVPSYRQARQLTIDVPEIGPITGDVAWGGNWFYLVENHGQRLEAENVAALTEFTTRIRRAINVQGFPEVDHIELFAPSSIPGVDSRNFVLCPGLAYDRSPCGTGTSAKLACLVADGKLREGQVWKQESIVGSQFEGSVRIVEGQVVPTIKGRAFITAQSRLILDAADPFVRGIHG